MSSKKAVVTGGAGFIGARLAARAAQTMETHVLDDLSAGRRDRLPPSIAFHEGSVLDEALLRGCFDGADVVFHLAAIPSVARSMAEPIHCHRVNVEGTLAVLEAARRADVRRVVLASSSAVYGDAHALPARENGPVRPSSPYAVDKLAAEHYARIYHELQGIETVCLRYFNVFGPGQDPESRYAAVIPRFVRAALAGEPLVIYGDGDATRDFVFVEDVVDANLAAARSTTAAGHILNIASGREMTIDALARLVLQMTGGASPIVRAPPRAGDVLRSVAAVVEAARRLDFVVRTPFEAGLATTIQASALHPPGAATVTA